MFNELDINKDYTFGQVLGGMGLLGILVYSVFFYGISLPEIERQAVIAATTTPAVAGEELGDVVERDGVLWYPDGQPVRNYEQLDIYLHGTH